MRKWSRISVFLWFWNGKWSLFKPVYKLMEIKSSVGYTTYNQRRYYKRKSNLAIGVKEDLIKVKGVFCWQNERNLQAFNLVSSLIVMNEILHLVIKNMELGNQMTFLVRPRPSGPWNEHRSWAREHVWVILKI